MDSLLSLGTPSTASAGRLWLLVLGAVLLALTGCSEKAYVRGSEVAGLDDPAMSTGLDKRDLDKLLKENLESLLASKVAQQWDLDRSRPRLAIYPLANETSEHIGSQLQALLSDIETFMVSSDLVDVISREMQNTMMAEVDRQHGGGFDPNRIAEYNKQLGAQFYITGKVYSADERTQEGRRVQYFMFLQVIEVATSGIRWQNKATLTKALIDD